MVTEHLSGTDQKAHSSIGTAISRSMGGALIGKAVAIVCGMATFALLARHLGAAGLGEYRTVLSILALCGAVFDFGLYQITLAELSKPNVDGPVLVGNALTLRVASTTIAILLAALISLLIGLDRVIVIGILVGGVGWVAYRVSEWAMAIFQRRLAQQRVAASEIAGVVATLLAVAALTRTDAGTIATLAATTFGWFIALFVMWILGKKLISCSPHFNRTISIGLIKKGLPIGASKILEIVQLRADVLILAAVGVFLDVGIYDVGLKVYEILATLPYLFGGLLMPLFVNDFRTSEAMIARRLQATIAIILIICSLAVVVVMVHAEAISVLLAGPQFRNSGNVMRLLILAVMFAAMAHPLRFAAIAINRQATMLRIDIVACTAAITAYAILIPRFGSLGAATGKIVGDSTILVVTLFLLRRQLNARIWRCFPVAATGAALLFLLLQAGKAIGLHWLIASLLGGLLVASILLTVPFVRRELAALTRAHA